MTEYDDYVLIADLDPELREKCQCSDVTLTNWLHKYDVAVNHGVKKLGIKVGGQWRISPSLLREFLKGRGVPKM